MQTTPRPVSRQSAIRWLREAAIKLTGECSRCQRATDHGVYCLGFRRFTEEELRLRYTGLVESRSQMTPEELSDLANRWRMTLQFLERVSEYCQGHRARSEQCAGWEGFSSEELERFCFEILGEPIRIV